MEMDAQSMSYIAEAAKYIGMGMMSLVMLSVAKGVASVFTTIITCISRNPNIKQEVSVFAWVGAAMTEAIALYALVLAIMVLFK